VVGYWLDKHQRCLHAASGFGKTDFEGFTNFADGSAQYKFIPQNTSFNGDYGNATGPDGTYTGLLHKLMANLMQVCQLKSCRLLLFSSRYCCVMRIQLFTAWCDWFRNLPDDRRSRSIMTYNKTTKVWTVTLNLSANVCSD
jgi:hypothetical protein